MRLVHVRRASNRTVCLALLQSRQPQRENGESLADRAREGRKHGGCLGGARLATDGIVEDIQGRARNHVHAEEPDAGHLEKVAFLCRLVRDRVARARELPQKDRSRLIQDRDVRGPEVLRASQGLPAV